MPLTYSTTYNLFSTVMSNSFKDRKDENNPVQNHFKQYKSFQENIPPPLRPPPLIRQYGTWDSESRLKEELRVKKILRDMGLDINYNYGGKL